MPEGRYTYTVRTGYAEVEVEGTGIEETIEEGLYVKDGEQNVAHFVRGGYQYWTRSATA